jgi:hypothetical protein
LTKALPVYCNAIAEERQHGIIDFGAQEGLVLTVAMIMIHFGQHVHRIRVKDEIGTVHDAKGVQLMAKYALSKHKLSSVCSV